MTAVEWLIQELITRDRFVPDFLEQQAKEMEKQQIIDAYCIGKYINVDDREFGEKFYNETYGSKGSDEIEKSEKPINLTSSQTEISDEEIEKEADKYSDAYDCPSKIKLCKHDIKAAFINSIGWYREQLKKKQ